jgi:hypothetical protein
MMVSSSGGGRDELDGCARSHRVAARKARRESAAAGRVATRVTRSEGDKKSGSASVFEPKLGASLHPQPAEHAGYLGG